MSLACITNPSLEASQALLQAALQYGTKIAFKKPVRRVPAFTKAMSRDQILALPATECSICLCDVDAGDADCGGGGAAAFELGCGHFFHPGCIAPWLRRSETCPTCRWRCRAMKHAVVKRGAGRVSRDSVDDGWVDQALQEGDRVWVKSCSREGSVQCVDVESNVVCVELRAGEYDCFAIDDVTLLLQVANMD